MESLLDTFITSESTFACQRVLDAVHAQKTNPIRVRDTLDFNVFYVEILYEERIAVLEDILDVSPRGTLRMDLDAFVRRLQQAV